MRSCQDCAYEPRWDCDDPATKGVCRWSEQFDGVMLPDSVKSWMRMYEDFSTLMVNLMQPVTRDYGYSCNAFKPKRGRERSAAA